MLLSQPGVEVCRDRGVCRVQALTELGEALGKTQGLPSLQTECGRGEKDSTGGSCGRTAEMGEGLMLELQGSPNVHSSQVTVWDSHMAARCRSEGYTWRHVSLLTSITAWQSMPNSYFCSCFLWL